MINYSWSFGISGSFSFHISTNLKIAYIILDFPAPVLPITPTFSPLLILNDIDFKVFFNSFLYLNLTFLNLIDAFTGQFLSSYFSISVCYFAS